MKSGLAGSLVALVGATALLVAGCGSSTPQQQPGASGKSLSQSSITFGTGSRSDSALIYIAQAAGYFADEGLNVKMVDTSLTASTADITAAFFGGSYDLLNNGATTAVIADQAAGGHALTAVMQTDVGSNQEIAINAGRANSLHLPADDGSSAASLARFKALKGSHLKVGVTSMTSISTVDLLAACKTQGLSCRSNSDSADLDIVTTGTPTAQIAGLNSGKFDSIVAGPPTTRQPDTTLITLGKVDPVSQAVNDYVLVLPRFLHAHPDTVQAAVNALGKAWQLAKQDPAKAEQMAAGMYAAAGIKDPKQPHELFTTSAQYWTNPIPTQQAYDDTVHVINLSQSSPITLPFGQFADPSFAKKMVAQLGLKVGS
jgi:NitT/TauT family transport system substrate-binding protein